MKNWIFALLILAFLPLSAQKIEEKDVPEVVKQSLQLAYPDNQSRTWNMREGLYVAQVKAENHLEYASFLENGEWVDTRYAVELDEIPENIPEYLKTQYNGYKVLSYQYVEENHGGSYYLVLVALKSNKVMTSELTFSLSGEIQKIDGMITQGDQLVMDSVVNKGQAMKAMIEITPPEAVLKMFIRRFPNAKNLKWKISNELYLANFEFRNQPYEAEFSPEGEIVSTTNFFDKKSMIPAIEEYLSQNNKKAKFIEGRRTIYENRYARKHPEKNLKSFYSVEISEKVDKNKEPKHSKLFFDQSGQLDMIVEILDK